MRSGREPNAMADSENRAPEPESSNYGSASRFEVFHRNGRLRRLLADAVWVLLGAVVALVVVFICLCVVVNAFIEQSSGM